MGPSRPHPEPGSPASRDRIALLDEIERRWRDALSMVADDDPQAAAREIERAGELLQQLGRLEEPGPAAVALAPAAVAAFSERMQRLSRLHRELLGASRNAQAAIGRTLAQARDGRVALRAYGSDRDATHAFDQVI